MPKTKKKDNQKIIKLAAFGALIVVLVGITAYALVQTYSNTPSTQPDSTSQQQHKQPAASGADAKREAGIILSKVKMEMTKDEVVAAVGQPHSCSSGRNQEDSSYTMEQCSYGQKEAPGHVLITFMNGKVWGTTYETGSIYTDSQQ